MQGYPWIRDLQGRFHYAGIRIQPAFGNPIPYRMEQGKQSVDQGILGERPALLSLGSFPVCGQPGWTGDDGTTRWVLRSMPLRWSVVE